MPVLEGVDLTKRFGGVVALDGVSFGIERGETVGLIGPNGAGKTTLFEVLTGVHSPTEGKVIFDGDDVTGMAPQALSRRGLAKTHQIVRPFRNMTLAENVAVGARFGAGVDDPDAVATEMLEFVGLGGAANESPDGLSIGALKRLEIARVLATDPEVLLADEVAGGLDPEETKAIVDLLEQIRDRGHTVFLIDHVMRAVMAASDRVLVLDSGELVARGSPAEIRTDDRVREAYLGETTTGEGGGEVAEGGDAG